MLPHEYIWLRLKVLHRRLALRLLWLTHDGVHGALVGLLRLDELH